MSPPSVIALLTDFGHRDTYVGVMKGVILSRLPDARIVDLSHEVPAQNVLSAAFLLEAAWRFFPENTVFVVVVDPGVGSARRRIAVQRQGRTFIGPDNGCLSAVLPDELRGGRSAGEAYAARPVRLGDGVGAFSIENAAIIASETSATFEGRDVFAPAAAYVAAGQRVEGLGPAIGDLLAFPRFEAVVNVISVEGVVLHVDHYGNAITDIRAEQCRGSTAVIASGRRLALARTYADAEPGQAVALIGSSGYLEVAVRDGSAANTLAIRPGDAVVCQ